MEGEHHVTTEQGLERCVYQPREPTIAPDCQQHLKLKEGHGADSPLKPEEKPRSQTCLLYTSDAADEELIV